MEKLLTTKEVSTFLSVPQATLSVWRQQKKALNFIRMPKGVRYQKSDIDNYLKENTVEV